MVWAQPRCLQPPRGFPTGAEFVAGRGLATVGGAAGGGDVHGISKKFMVISMVISP